MYAYISYMRRVESTTRKQLKHTSGMRDSTIAKYWMRTYILAYVCWQCACVCVCVNVCAQCGRYITSHTHVSCLLIEVCASCLRSFQFHSIPCRVLCFMPFAFTFHFVWCHQCVYCSLKICQECLSQRNRTKLESSNQVEFFLITVLSLSLSIAWTVRVVYICMWHAFLLSNFTGTVHFSSIYFPLSLDALFIPFFCLSYHFFPFIWVRKPKDPKDMMGLKMGRIHLATLVGFHAFNKWYIFFNYFMHHS